jgi:beta-glucosidase
VPSSVLSPPGAPSSRGLRAEYWGNTGFAGAPEEVRVERRVAASAGFFDYQSVNAASVEPAPPPEFALAPFSARWTGTLTAPATGDFAFTLTSRGRAWMWLGGALVIDHSDEHALASRSATVHLAKGERYDLRVDYSADHPDIGVATDLGGDVRLGWQPPAGAVVPGVRDAAALAASSDVAIVVVRDYGTEERDRLDLALPAGQDPLVRAVAAANPRTIVVLTTGQPASMPWLDAVPAVVEAWYAGQEQGNAIARVLFGDVNPSGKLPITFPRTLDATPAGAGTAGDGVVYAEGPLVGYRWYDAHGVDPLFPFGFGLSYTTFRYDDLQVEPGTPGGAPPARVTFSLTNTGSRAGAEVAQVYVGACPGDARPRRQLAGFAKVPLAPGATTRVAVDLAPEAFSWWDPGAHAWTTPACDLPLAVASSSRDARLQGQLHVAADGSVAAAAGGGAATSSHRGGCGAGEGADGTATSLLALGLAWLVRLTASARSGPSRPASPSCSPRARRSRPAARTRPSSRPRPRR